MVALKMDVNQELVYTHIPSQYVHAYFQADPITNKKIIWPLS